MPQIRSSNYANDRNNGFPASLASTPQHPSPHALTPFSTTKLEIESSEDGNDFSVLLINVNPLTLNIETTGGVFTETTAPTSEFIRPIEPTSTIVDLRSFVCDSTTPHHLRVQRYLRGHR
ncbi:hypothetical protein FRC01_002231, partial [Tulasnella sp. 417]